MMLVSYICNTTNATSGIGTDHPPGAPEFNPSFFSYNCLFVCFLLVIVLSVLVRFNAFDYMFCIFKRLFQ